MQKALSFKCRYDEDYIEFLGHFGPVLTGITCWNNSKKTKLLSEILTITDEAFIHICIINYSATWKAQEENKSLETDVQVPVSAIH